MLKFHPLRLKARTEAAEDAVCLSFELPPALREAFRFEAGQHIAVRIDAGGEERRTYSIVSPEGSDELRIGVRHQARGRVSPLLARELPVGAAIDVLTPNGSFHTQIEPGHARWRVAFAAGSGITPVLSIAATVLEREPASRFTLFYGNRTAASTMFLDEVMALKNRHPARFAVYFLMSREPQDIGLLNGRIDAAHVREFARLLFDAGAVDEFFLCGPGSMNDEVAQVLSELGATGKVHTEHFSVTGIAAAPPAVAQAVAPIAEPAVAVDDVRVSVVMDGRRRAFTLSGALGETVLDAADRAGIDLPYSCRAGVCSTCRAKLLKGTVEMEQNHALEDWELAEGFVLCCQARPTSSEIELTYDA